MMTSAKYVLVSLFIVTNIVSEATFADPISGFQAGERVFRKSDIEIGKVQLETVNRDTRGSTSFMNDSIANMPTAELLSLNQVSIAETPDGKINAQNTLKVNSENLAHGFFQVSRVANIDGKIYLLGHFFSYKSAAFKDFMTIADLKLLVSGMYEHTRSFDFGPLDIINYDDYAHDIKVASDEAKCVDLQTQRVCQRTQYKSLGVGYIFDDGKTAVVCSKSFGCGAVDFSRLTDVDEVHLFNLNDQEILQALKLIY